MNPKVDLASPRPLVLLAGTGRSGTSWLGKLLDASPRVFYKPEPDDRSRFPWFVEIPSRLDEAPENEAYREKLSWALERAFYSHCVHFARPPDFAKDFLRPVPWKLMNLGLRGLRKVRGSTPILEIPYWMFQGDEEPVFAVKSVSSNLRLAWIHRHFPDFRIVMIVRHPGGYLWSWVRAARDQGWRGFGDRARLDGTLLPFPRPEHAKYEKAYEQGEPFERELIYWIVANETPILELGQSEAFKAVIYERLCENPETELRRVYEHCAIPFEQQTQQFLYESISEHRHGFHAVHKDPRRVSGEWRHELSVKQIGTVERYLEESFLSSYWRDPVPTASARGRANDAARA